MSCAAEFDLELMLRIGQSEYDAIRRHGEETYPHECCGVLLGHADEDGRTVTKTIRCGNTRSDSPHNRYNIAPQELVHIQRQAREKGLEIVGFYHSHPDHPARPSQYDLDHAWPTFAYIIVAVATGAARDMTVWFLKDDRSIFEEGSLHHGENSHPDTAQTVHG